MDDFFLNQLVNQTYNIMDYPVIPQPFSRFLCFYSISLRFRRSVFICILIFLFAGLVHHITAQTVTDSIRVTRSVATWSLENGTCAAGVIGTWPDAAARVLDEETTYNTYRLVVVDGSFIPRGNGEIVPRNGFFDEVPTGHFGHDPRLPGGSAGCRMFGELIARANARVATGSTFLLNGAQYTMGDWYATYSVPDGTPVAEFMWAQTEGLTVAFDGSFESDLSREVTAEGPVPVVDYDWDFGDGNEAFGAKPQHTYAEPGTYSVALTVTDDDGETDTATYEVDVAGAILAYRTVVPREVMDGDTLRIDIEVTNTGTVDAAKVTVSRDLILLPDYPTEPEGFRRNARASAALFGTGDTTITSGLAVGETLRLTQAYVIEQAAQVVNMGVVTEVPIDWKTQVDAVSGEDIAGRAAKTEDMCLADDCDDTVRILPPLPPELFVSTVADPDTVGVGGVFDLLVIVRNAGEGPAKEVRTDGPLTILSPNGGSAMVVSGPEPAQLAQLEPEARDTLVYRVEAEALGTLEFNVSIIGLDVNGEEVSAPPECIVSGGSQFKKPALNLPADGQACSAEVTEIIVVNDTRDEGDYNTEDGRCDAFEDDGTDGEEGDQCTLRAAIEEANAHGGTTINFNIDGEPLIEIESEKGALPSFSEKIVLDGTTQTGGWVEIAGPNAITNLERNTPDLVGLEIGSNAGRSKIGGIAIHSFAEAGIRINEGADNSIIKGNRIGTDLTGTQPQGGGADTGLLWITQAEINESLRYFNFRCGGQYLPCTIGAGLHIRSNGNMVLDNTITGNFYWNESLDSGGNETGYGGGINVLLDRSASENVLSGNHIGIETDDDFSISLLNQQIYKRRYEENCNFAPECVPVVGVLILGNNNQIGGPNARNRIAGHHFDIWVPDFSELGTATSPPPMGNRIEYNDLGLSESVDVLQIDGFSLLSGQQTSAVNNAFFSNEEALAVRGLSNSIKRNIFNGFIAGGPSRPAEDLSDFNFSIYGSALSVQGSNHQIESNTITSENVGITLRCDGANILILDNEIQASIAGIATMELCKNEELALQETRIEKNTIKTGSFGSHGLVALSGVKVKFSDNTIDTKPSGKGITLSSTIDHGSVGPPRFLLQRNEITGNLGIDVGNDGVTPNDFTDLDEGPNNLLNYPRALQATSEGNSVSIYGTLEGTFGATYSVELFGNTSCGAYKYFGAPYGSGETYLGTATIETSVTDFGEHTFLLQSDGLTDEHQYATLTSSRLDLGITSEFSRCVRISGPDEVASNDVAANQSGPVLEALDTRISIENNGNSAGKSAKNTTQSARHPGGKVFATLYDTAPDSSVFAEVNATAPNGTLITPQAIAPRHWLLAEQGLTTLPDGEASARFQVCLAPTDAVASGQLEETVLIQRNEQTNGWLSIDTAIEEFDGELYLCADGLTQLGEFGIGGAENLFTTTNEEAEPEMEIPKQISLGQNYPNPFNPNTIIPYNLKAPGHVQIAVYDLLGRRVQSLVDATMPAGRHQVSFDAGQLSTGIYIYQLSTGPERITRKMMLIK